ncbi:hypothetical protein FC70_GL001436 [Paucilactobacillus oligofermentans DSM 15707 = LMG 22743]|uniref:Uncharacterized protein n=2 Tax=Paucilactobacillus oligofermentans TaxID=293371 RepID=A0A0R1RCG6_9LACO|nr:hypothetical protein FC70_GL001436 [Paucilactobacillus oligofermentans DSM 15707 = LMG 22743]
MRMIRQLRRFGKIEYSSTKMHYVILYVNQDQIDDIKERINKLKFVKRVQLSHRPDVDPTMSDLNAAGIYHKLDEDEN